MTTQTTVVWTEIPVTDLDAATAFYSEVFGWTMRLNDQGPNPIMDFSSDEVSVGGHLYPGKPASGGNGPTIHLAVPDTLEACAARAQKAGGTILGPVIMIPPGRFQYAMDPDGNSIGLFEPAKAA